MSHFIFQKITLSYGFNSRDLQALTANTRKTMRKWFEYGHSKVLNKHGLEFKTQVNRNRKGNFR